MKTKNKSVTENKDYMLRVRMSNMDLKQLNKISKILKSSNSETIRLLIETKIKELNKQKNIFE
jgi:hypothetical protein